jgi:hypothetical protein
MFSGIQEILVLVIILLGILFLPRIMNRGQEKKTVESKPMVALSGKMRLAVGASIIWPAIMAAYLQPWRSDLILFLYSGPGPVILGWIIFWVLTGFRSK